MGPHGAGGYQGDTRGGYQGDARGRLVGRAGGNAGLEGRRRSFRSHMPQSFKRTASSHSATTATPDQVAAGMEHADTGGASLALVQLLWCLSAQLGPVRLLILHGLSSQNLALITSD